MTRYDKRVRLLAAALSAVAGYVDALGFIALGGFFVSFMSGNTTRLGVGLATEGSEAAVAGGLIATFVAGVTAGSLAGRAAGRWKRPAVLLLVAALLACAAALAMLGAPAMAAFATALAMGVENAAFEEEGEVRIGLTYMTGTLVKLGQRLASTIGGGERLAWPPYLLLWAGLAAGAVAGALAYPRMGLAGLWIAAAAMILLALVAVRIEAAGGEAAGR